MNILLASSDARSRLELLRILSDLRCHVSGQVRQTDDLMDEVAANEPRLLVLDVNLRGSFDPIVSLRRLHRRDPALKVIVTGGISQSAILMEALSEGADEFLTRPFNRRDVANCLDRMA